MTTHVLDCFITQIDADPAGELMSGKPLRPVQASVQFEARGPGDREFDFRGTITVPYDECPSIYTPITVAVKFHPPVRVRIKDGWEDAGRLGTLVHTHQMSDQNWSMVLWDGEEDPETFKTRGLMRENGKSL